MINRPTTNKNIPVSVIVMTKNEEENIKHSLPPLLRHFDEVFIVDSNSQDATATIARRMGARVVPFTWDGHYPKKKQWCAENITTRHEWIFICDADEIVTDDFVHELQTCQWDRDGYFIPSQTVWNDRLLRRGMRNNKLCLYKKSAFSYPVVDDLDIAGGWEVEGHYQPIPASPFITIGQIKSAIIHHDASNRWIERHQNYAKWEAAMTLYKLWPKDPVKLRNILKLMARNAPFRPFLIFVYSYVIKAGFMDGRAGFDYAAKRAWYARHIHYMFRVIRRSNAVH